jgi:hypothetical protein
VIAALASIPSLSFVIVNGFSIIPVITELNVSPSFFLSNLFYNWHPFYAGGFDNSQSSWFVFPIGGLFVALSSIGLNSAMISIFFMFIVYYFHGISMYYLTYVVGNIEGSLSRTSRIVAASFYMFTPFTLLYMHELGSQQFLASAVLPLLVGFLVQGLFQKKLSYCIYIGLASIFAGANVAFFVISIVVLLAYIIYDLVIFRKNLIWKLIFAATMIGLIFASNIFWLLPRLSNFTTEITGAFREGESVSRSIVLNSLSSSYYETFRLMGSWAFQPAYFSYFYQFYSPIIIVATFIAPIFGMTALLLKPRKRFEIFAVLITIICLPLAVGAYPISNPHLTGRIYIWLYQNVPFFIIFRGAYKFVMVIAFSYSFLIALSLTKLSRKDILKKKRTVTPLVTLGLIGVLLLGSFPSFYGQIVEKEKSFSIPQYYYEAADWLKTQEGNFRIMTIPEMMHVLYVWDNETKFTGTDVSVPLFKIPIVGRSYYLSPGSSDMDMVTHQIYRMIIANQTQNLASLLVFLNVKYVMIHGDYKWSVLQWNQPVSYLFDVLEKTPNMRFARSFGELYFFENEFWFDSTVFVFPSADNQFLDLFTSETSDFDPEITANVSNWKIEDNLLTSNDLYNYDDDVILSKIGHTNLTLTFEAKVANKYLHVYFFAMDKKNAYRLWLNETDYELGKITNGLFSVFKSQRHAFQFNISSWNSYEIEFGEGIVKLAVNGHSFDIDYADKSYIAGKVGFASPTNIVWIRSAKLKYLSTKTDFSSIRPCSYVKVNPTKYIVSLQNNISMPAFLVFTNSFYDGWNAFAGEKLQHVKALNYANGWYLNQTEETLTLEYSPQGFYEFSFKIWFLIIVGFALYLTYTYTRTHHILYKLKQKLARTPHKNN